MAEYIEREAAINAICRLCSDTTRDKCSIQDICNHVCRLEAVHAADVRPVVLCRDCKHWEKYDNTAGCGYCNKVKFEYGQIGYVFKPVREPDFFCADGEKREES